MQALVLTCLQYKSLETHWEKGESACNGFEATIKPFNIHILKL